MARVRLKASASHCFHFTRQFIREDSTTVFKDNEGEAKLLHNLMIAR